MEMIEIIFSSTIQDSGYLNEGWIVARNLQCTSDLEGASIILLNIIPLLKYNGDIFISSF